MRAVLQYFLEGTVVLLGKVLQYFLGSTHSSIKVVANEGHLSLSVLLQELIHVQVLAIPYDIREVLHPISGYQDARGAAEHQV